MSFTDAEEKIDNETLLYCFAADRKTAVNRILLKMKGKTPDHRPLETE